MPPVKTSGEYTKDWPQIRDEVKRDAGYRCIRCGHAHDPSVGRTLTVHHFEGTKSRNPRWNLMALCQSCHLIIQQTVDPRTPYLFMPSAWSMPYIAGWYASGDQHAYVPEGYDVRDWIAVYEQEIGTWPKWAPRR